MYRFRVFAFNANLRRYVEAAELARQQIAGEMPRGGATERLIGLDGGGVAVVQAGDH